MNRRIQRRIATVIIILLPVVILWKILPYFDPGRILPKTPADPPKWVEDGRHYFTCSEAMSGTPAQGHAVAIDVTRAITIGAGSIESQTNIVITCSNSNHNLVSVEPRLVERQFPDGQSRLAWVYGEGCVTDKISMSAKVEIVY